MKLKHLIPLALAAMTLAACNKQNDTQWEYKIVTLSENLTLQAEADRLAMTMAGRVGCEGMFSINFEDPSSTLNELGEQGWELVSTYTTTETLFPNMGNADYHTGVKTNTRTKTINFVFKRIASKKKADNALSNNGATPKATQEDVLVVEDVIEPFDTTAIDSVSPYGY